MAISPLALEPTAREWPICCSVLELACISMERFEISTVNLTANGPDRSSFRSLLFSTCREQVVNRYRYQPTLSSVPLANVLGGRRSARTEELEGLGSGSEGN